MPRHTPLALLKSSLLRFSLLSLIAAPASATTPPPPPPCPDIGSSFRSAASLMDAVRAAKDEHARNCAADALRRRDGSLHWAWVALMHDPDPAIQKLATGHIRGHAYAAGAPAYHIGYPNLERAGLPRSALRRFIELSAAQGEFDCGGGHGFISDAGRDAVPVLSGLLADSDPRVRGAAVRCLGTLGYQARSAAPLLVNMLGPDAVTLQGPGDVKSTLPRVGVYAAGDFQSMVARLNAHAPSDLLRLAAEDMAAFSALPPATLPQLLEAVRKARIQARKESGARRYFVNPTHHPHPGLAHALAATRTASAVEALIADEAYEFIPAAGPVAVPLLIERLSKTSSIDERVHIAQALERIGTPAAARAARQETGRLLPGLLADLRRKDPGFSVTLLHSTYRLPAMERFRVLGALAAPARPALLAMLEGRPAERHYKAALVLGYLHAFEAEPRLVALREQSLPPGVKRTYEYAAYGTKAAFFAAALDALRKAPGYSATLTLEQLQAMISATTRPYQGLAPEAALAELAQRGPAAIPQLMALLDSADERERGYAIHALAAMGPAANMAFDALVARLNDPRDAHSLGTPGPTYLAHMGMRSDEGMERLFRQVVESENEGGRYYSAQVLGEMGNPAHHMIAPLRAALKDPALWRYGGGPPDSLVYLLTGAHLPKREAPDAAPPSFDAIGTFLQRKHCGKLHWSETGACEVLQGLPDAGLGAIRPVLKHADAALRIAASDYLGSLGPRAAKAAPELAGLLGDPAPRVRRAAAENLGRILGPGNYSPALVAYLLAALESNDQDEATGAAVLLGTATELPSSGVPRLEAALRRPALQSFQEPLLAAIGHTHSAAGANALVSYLRQAGSQTGRDDAVTALGAGGSAALPVLLGAIRDEAGPDEAAALAAALAMQAHPEASERAAATGAWLLGMALAAIDTADNPADTPAVWHIHTRREGARRLAALMRFYPPAREAGVAALNNPDREIVATLVHGLGEYGDPAVLPALAPLRVSPLDPIRHAAEDAAASIMQRYPTPLQRWNRCTGINPTIEDIDRCRPGGFRTLAGQE